MKWLSIPAWYAFASDPQARRARSNSLQWHQSWPRPPALCRHVVGPREYNKQRPPETMVDIVQWNFESDPQVSRFPNINHHLESVFLSRVMLTTEIMKGDGMGWLIPLKKTWWTNQYTSNSSDDPPQGTRLDSPKNLLRKIRHENKAEMKMEGYLKK